MKKIFIINVASRAIYYGIGTYTSHLIESLSGGDYDINVVTLYVPNLKEFEIIAKDSINYITIPVPQEGYSTSFFYTKEDENYQKNVGYILASLVSQDEEVLFHFNFMQLGYLASLLKAKLSKSKIIVCVHYMQWSFDLLGRVNELERILLFPQDTKEREIKNKFDYEKVLLCEMSDYIISIAQHSYDTLYKLYDVPISKITLISNAVKDRYKKSSSKQVIHLKNKYGVSKDELILVFVGRLAPVKGVEYLIDSFKILNTKIPNSKLLIIGEGNEEDFKFYLTKAKPLWSKINFTGYLSKKEIDEICAIVDIGIVPSIHEEFGLVAIELMMNGVPLIVNESTGLSEIIKDGFNGTLLRIDTDNIDKSLHDFANKIIELANNKPLRDRYSRNGRKRFLEYYEIQLFREKMKEFYFSI